MANPVDQVEHIVIANTFVGTATYAGNTAAGNFDRGVSNPGDTLEFDELLRGEFTVVDPATNKGIVLASIPNSAVIVSHGTQANRRSIEIPKGSVLDYGFSDYNAGTPLSYTITFGSAPAINDQVTLKLRYQAEKSLKLLPYVFSHVFKSTNLQNEVDEMVETINNELMGPLTYVDQFLVASRGGSGGSSTLILTATKPKLSLTNIESVGFNYFTAHLERCFTASEPNVAKPGWTAVFPNITKTRTATNINPLGTTDQVTTHWNQTGRGHINNLNRVRYVPNGYDPIDPTVEYDQFWIEFNPLIGRPGEPNRSSEPKRITIYYDSAYSGDGGTIPLADAADTRTYLTALAEGLK